MRIMITNDDGIHAPGLAAAERIARSITDDVWVIAPMAEMSGVGHCISYTRPVRTDTLGAARHAVDGTPADCVLVGLTELMKDAPPDLILSGVNRGNNIAENTLYSGTVGATIEAALHNVRSVALSQFYGPKNRDLPNPFEAAEAHAPDVIRRLVRSAPWEGDPYGLFYNVNFPPCPADNVRGAMATVQGRRPGSLFRAEPYLAPNQRTYYWLAGGPQHVSSAPGSDAHANLDDYISVTPARADLTAHDMVSAVADALG